MRISDWSSDVCSSDLRDRRIATNRDAADTDLPRDATCDLVVTDHRHAKPLSPRRSGRHRQRQTRSRVVARIRLKIDWLAIEFDGHRRRLANEQIERRRTIESAALTRSDPAIEQGLHIALCNEEPRLAGERTEERKVRTA